MISWYGYNNRIHGESRLVRTLKVVHGTVERPTIKRLSHTMASIIDFAPKSALLQNHPQKAFCRAELRKVGVLKGTLPSTATIYKLDQGPGALQRQSWNSLQAYMEFIAWGYVVPVRVRPGASL